MWPALPQELKPWTKSETLKYSLSSGWGFYQQPSTPRARRGSQSPVRSQHPWPKPKTVIELKAT